MKLGHDGLLPRIDLAPRAPAIRTAGALEVRALHDDSVLVAIDAALRSPAFCACGNNLTVTVHDGAAWLTCASLSNPSRLPSFIREGLHDRRWVVDLPQAA